MIEGAEKNGTLDARELLKDIKTLPPLPAVALRIMQTMSNEFMDGAAVADIVADDPSISARLISLANSAYFSVPTPVYDMCEVVNRVLGADTVRTLALGLATRNVMQTRACPSFDALAFWRRALCASHSCERLAALDPAMPVQERSSAYLLGLCHELGLLALVTLAPGRMNDIMREDPRAEAAAIEADFGFSLPSVTHALAEHWKLPELVVEIYAQCADSVAQPHGLTRILQLALRLNQCLVDELQVDEALAAQCSADIDLPLEPAQIAVAVNPSDAQMARLRNAAAALSQAR